MVEQQQREKCSKCEGWGCSYCSHNVISIKRQPLKLEIQEPEPEVEDGPLSPEQAIDVMLQTDAVLAKIAKQKDLLKELRLLAMVVLAAPVTGPNPRVPHRCANCGAHEYNDKLMAYEGRFYHKLVCWRRP